MLHMDYGRKKWRIKTARQWKRLSKHLAINLNLYERQGGEEAWFVDIRDVDADGPITSYHHHLGGFPELDVEAAYKNAVALADSDEWR